MSACPDFLLEKATRRGIAREEVLQKLWPGHTRWCNEHGKDAGGLLWDALLDKYIDRVKGESKLGEGDAMAEAERELRRANDRLEKDRADAEYAKTTISLQEYIDELRLRPDFGEAMTPLEQHIAKYRDPRPGEDSAAWLLSAVDGYSGPTPEAHIRRRKV